MKYEISLTKTNHSRLNEVDFDNIPFGRVFSDHMFVMEYEEGAWHSPRIVPFDYIQMHPAAMVLPAMRIIPPWIFFPRFATTRGRRRPSCSMGSVCDRPWRQNRFRAIAWSPKSVSKTGRNCIRMMPPRHGWWCPLNTTNTSRMTPGRIASSFST